MKKIIFLFVALFVTSIGMSWAQAPSRMSYQAVIRNSSDELVKNQEIGMRISILQGDAEGTVVYTEIPIENTTTNANGLIAIEFGGRTGWNTIDWSTGWYYIKVETDITGGTNYTITSTTRLLSVPYALYAESSGTTAPGSNRGDIQWWNGSHWVFLPIGTVGQVLTVGENNSLEWQTPGSAPSFVCGTSTVTDLDGNVYTTVQIGTQCWFKQNLRTTKFSTGEDIPLKTTLGEWTAHVNGEFAMCYDQMNSDNAVRGGLYNFWTAANANLCPAGWHVPTDQEFGVLTDYLIANGYNWDNTTEGNKIAKSMAAVAPGDKGRWDGSTVDGAPGNTEDASEPKRNSSGFSAEPNGWVYSMGFFGGSTGAAYLRSSSEAENGITTVCYYVQNLHDGFVRSTMVNRRDGMPVRCVRD
jgi:uncharacterized protein (TIGR02145 family)